MNCLIHLEGRIRQVRQVREYKDLKKNWKKGNFQTKWGEMAGKKPPNTSDPGVPQFKDSAERKIGEENTFANRQSSARGDARCLLSWDQEL